MNRIVLKWGGSILLLFLIVFIPFGFIFHLIYSNLYYSDVEEQIDELSSRYANAMSSVEDSDVLQMFVTLASFTNNEVYIVDRTGTIVIDSGITGIVTGENISEKERMQLESGNPVYKEYHFLPSTERYLVAGKPIFNESSFQGGIFVMSSLDAIDHSIAQVKQFTLITSVVAFVIGAGFIFMLSRKISAPLIEMEEATRQISKGDLNTRVKIHSNDEIGQLAKAINDLALELARYRSNRQEFFANISHELRTPLTYLQGYANVLKQEMYTSEAEKQQYLTIIVDETQRLIHLINDLFDLSKAEEGQLVLEHKEVNVVQIMSSVINKAMLKANEKGLEIQKMIPDQPVLMYGDEKRLEQIFINLLENAIRYTEKGSLTVRVEQLPNQKIKCSVSDSGIGIPQEDLPYIFERFHRVEKSRSRDYGGTGLGLSIVKKLVELHRGTISVYSELGKGTTFEITFPQSFDRTDTTKPNLS